MNKIIFVYKGRYFVRDTETISYLSAIAKSAGYKTELVYDPDIFGITDNVLFMPFLNKVFSSSERIMKQIKNSGSELVVFLENFTNKDWIKEILELMDNQTSEIKTVVISPLGENFEKADVVLSGKPQKVWVEYLGVQFEKEILPDKDLFSSFVDFNASYMVYTSTGCIGNCSYCEETIYKSRYGNEYYSRRSVMSVIAELKLVKEKYNPREVIFKDSVFAYDKKWLRGFLEIYRSEIKIPFKCFARADVFDEEIAGLLKESGCYCVEFGVQTLNEKIRKEILFRRETKEDIVRALKICDSYRLSYDLDHMFGLPQESISDHMEAARFYSRLKHLNRIKCHNLVVYPEAPIKRFIDEEIGSSPDFFTYIAGKPQMRFANKSFQKFFKLLPLLKKEMVNFIWKNNLWKLFYFIPTLMVMAGQFLIALRNGDKRFVVYWKQYPAKLKLALRFYE